MEKHEVARISKDRRVAWRNGASVRRGCQGLLV